MKRLHNFGALCRQRGGTAAAALLGLALLAGCSGTSSQPKAEGQPQGQGQGQGKGPGPAPGQGAGQGPGQGRRAVVVRTANPKQISIERQVDISGTLVS